MKKAIISILSISILIGVIGSGLNLVFGANTVSYISTVEIHGVAMQKYDFINYLKTLSYQFTDVSKLQLTLPTFNWGGSVLEAIASVGKILVLGINILIYPIRVASYIIGMLLAIVGINTQTYENNPLKWVIVLVNTLTELQIPMPN